jgi:basic amino acid/polyamine antiporter, APA family
MAARTLGTTTAALAVAASMVGTGVFTTTGLFLATTGSPGAVLIGWVIGGVAALAGAMCYAELGSRFPENGGEYALLSRAWHPAVGFVAAITTIVVGFAAPIAASGLAFATYLRKAAPFIQVDERILALGLVVGCTGLLLGRVRVGATALNLVTAAQLTLCVGITVVGLAMGTPSFLLRGPTLDVPLLSPSFAVGLIYVGYTYAGWNAAAYLAGELEDPGRTLPRGLLLGTAGVTVLYVALNAAILMSAEPTVLAGEVAVAHRAAIETLGPRGALALSGVVAFGLIGSVTAFLLTGSRVVEAVGAEHPALAFLQRSTPDSSPSRALGLLAGLSAALIATLAFDTLLQWVGFVLSGFAALTVLGVPWTRWRDPSVRPPFRAWGGPLFPIVFLAPTLWSMAHVVTEEPSTAFAGFLVVALSVALWVAVRATRSSE